MAETSSCCWGDKRQMAYPLITEVAPAPDSQRVAYVVREPLMTDEQSTFLTHLYLVAAAGDVSIQLTFGDHCNSQPRWSPDGQYLAFLSTRTGKTNIYVMRADGGEAWPVTRYDKTNVVALKWSPDGTRIAFLMAEPPTDEKEKATKAGDDAQLWDQDFDFTHLYSVPFAVGPRTAAEATQITRGRYHVIGFDWLPDGQSFALTHQPTPVADVWPDTRLATIAAAGTDDAPHDIALIAAWGGELQVSPNGRWIACVTGAQPAHWAYESRVVLYPAAGGEPISLAETPDSQPTLIGWAADSSAVYVGEAVGVTTQMWALPVSGEAGRPLTDTPLLKTAQAASANGQIAFVGEDFHQPNAIYLLEPTQGVVRELVRPALPADWPDAPLPQAETITWHAPDGQQVEGILIYPQGYQAGQRYPLVVVVHGGPTGVYQRSYLAAPGGYGNSVAFAERGFAVLRPNPRGSSGYGKAFRFANYHDWGGGDYRDIMAGVDHLIEHGIADPERLGIMGWSYGGFMTSWTITQTQRFKAACVGAGVTNLMSFNGTADIPSFVPDYFGGEFWDNPQIYQAHSALFQIKGVTTPTLVQHGDADIRVPLSQGREFYNALKRQGVPTEMVIYPRQGHLIDEPRLATDVWRRAVAWFERWLGK